MKFSERLFLDGRILIQPREIFSLAPRGTSGERVRGEGYSIKSASSPAIWWLAKPESPTAVRQGFADTADSDPSRQRPQTAPRPRAASRRSQDSTTPIQTPWRLRVARERDAKVLACLDRRE